MTQGKPTGKPFAEGASLLPWFILLFVLGGCTLAFAYGYGLSGSSWPAVLCTTLSLFGGLVWAGWPSPRRLRARVWGALVGLALAFLAWWLVPATNGQHLWSARKEAARQAEILMGLAAEDVPAFTRDRESRHALLEHFPRYGPEVRAAEESWLTRAIGHAREKALAMDPGEALEYLGALHEQLQPTGPGGTPIDFSEVCEEVVRHHLQAARERTRALLLGNEYEELDRLGATFEALTEREEAFLLSASIKRDLAQFRSASRFVAEVGRRGTAPKTR